MGSKSLSQYDTLGRGVSIDLSWDESPTITVVATANTGHTWRIRGKNPDTTEYLVDSSGATGIERTFDAPDDIRDFAFQVYYSDEGTYSSGKIFTVEFSDDSGDSGSGDDGDDDSGGGGDSSSESAHTLYVGIIDMIGDMPGYNFYEGNEDNRAKVTIERTWSDVGDYTTSSGGQVFMSNGDTVYYSKDRFKITAEAKSGYELVYYDFEGKQVPFYLSNFTSSGSSGTLYKLASADDVAVIAYVTSSSTVHIHDGTDFASYQCHIYNGSDWDIYTPYIHDGTDWYRYS